VQTDGFCRAEPAHGQLSELRLLACESSAEISTRGFGLRTSAINYSLEASQSN